MDFYDVKIKQEDTYFSRGLKFKESFRTVPIIGGHQWKLKNNIHTNLGLGFRQIVGKISVKDKEHFRNNSDEKFRFPASGGVIEFSLGYNF